MQKIQKENLAGPTQSKNLKIYSPLHTSSSEKYLPVTDNVSHIHQDMVWMNRGQACSSKLLFSSGVCTITLKQPSNKSSIPFKKSEINQKN